MFDLRRYWKSGSEAEPTTVVVFAVGLILMVAWLVVSALPTTVKRSDLCRGADHFLAAT